MIIPTDYDKNTVVVDLCTGGKLVGYTDDQPIYEFRAWLRNRLYVVVSVGVLYACGSDVACKELWSKERGNYLCVINPLR